MENLTAEEKGYLAGLIDAEMSIQVQKRQHQANGYVYEGYSVYLDMSNTEFELIQWLLDNIGGRWGHKKTPEKYSYRTKAYYWRLSGKETAKLLERIEHLLVGKKRAIANAVIQFPFGKKNEKAKDLKEEIYQLARKLNKRPKSPAATTKRFNSREAEAIV